MALAAATRLGPYEIRGLLGAGGMGEVYRALDPRLGREARAVAALSHPRFKRSTGSGRGALRLGAALGLCLLLATPLRA